jgi:hypothetical protein
MSQSRSDFTGLVLLLMLFLLFSLLISLLFVLQESKLCYERYEDITHQEVVGEWKENYTYQFPGAFEYKGDTSSCPYSSAYSCHLHPHGFRSAHQKFFPTNCELPEFNPTTFLQSLKNRRLLLSGDSTTLQFYVVLICSLHGISENIYKIEFPDPKSIHTLVRGEVYYPVYNATLLIAATHAKKLNNMTQGENPFQDYVHYAQLFSPYDIALLNFGMNFNSQEQMFHIVKQLSENFNETTNPFTRPIFLWRETSPQNFDSSEDKMPAGYYIYPSKAPCVGYPDARKAYQEDFRNRLSDHWMVNRYSIPIMRVHNVSALGFDQHYGEN